MALLTEERLRVAIVQARPVHLDLEASFDKATQLIRQAAEQGAQLVVFGETWLSGYPAWLDHCPEVAVWDAPATKAAYRKMFRSSVTVPGPHTRALGALCKAHGIYLGIGVNEAMEQGPAAGTLFNTFLLFDREGNIQVHHRKLMPTFTEKMLYGMGDGQGLRICPSPFGPIGGLICWEHWMPLSRQALHNQGECLHLALWPKVHEMHQVASRHYAFEGRCFVVAVGQMMQAGDTPEGLTLPDRLQEAKESWLLNGGSCVFGPGGQVLLPPQFDREALLMVDLEDLDQIYGERMALDTSGHYQRPDVFDFSVRSDRYF